MNGRRRKGGGGGRKSIAGSEYIQRRSAVRVWKFETAFRGRVLPKSQRESARDGNLTGGGLEEDKKKKKKGEDRAISISKVREIRIWMNIQGRNFAERWIDYDVGDVRYVVLTIVFKNFS